MTIRGQLDVLGRSTFAVRSSRHLPWLGFSTWTQKIQLFDVGHFQCRIYQLLFDSYNYLRIYSMHYCIFLRRKATVLSALYYMAYTRSSSSVRLRNFFANAIGRAYHCRLSSTMRIGGRDGTYTRRETRQKGKGGDGEERKEKNRGGRERGGGGRALPWMSHK